GDEPLGFVAAQIDVDDTGTPQSSFVLVAAALLDAVEDVGVGADVALHPYAGAEQGEPERRIRVAAVGELEVGGADLRDRRGGGNVLTQQPLVRADVRGGAKASPECA